MLLAGSLFPSAMKATEKKASAAEFTNISSDQLLKKGDDYLHINRDIDSAILCFNTVAKRYDAGDVGKGKSTDF